MSIHKVQKRKLHIKHGKLQTKLVQASS